MHGKELEVHCQQKLNLIEFLTHDSSLVSISCLYDITRPCFVIAWVVTTTHI